MIRTIPTLVLLLAALVLADKPRVAVFPISGEASEKERERAAYSIRAKLDRGGVYEPIDGYTMRELAGDRKIDFFTSIDDVKQWSADEKPDVIIWGQMGGQLKLNILDLRDKAPKARPYEADINHATDVRFAVEKLIETLPGIKGFEHASEQAVTHDEIAEKLWRENPNLMTEGTFDAAGEWRGLLRSDKYAPEVVDRAPNADEVVIRKLDGESVLAMKLSNDVATTNGLACLSGRIPVEPDTRYRISFRYQSDGPKIRPFIKGYFTYKGEEREIYRRQVPPRGETDGQWVEVVDELNPQHTTFQVEYLRVDFYAYLRPGTVMWDDVVIKAVGAPTRDAKDAALDRPVGKNADKIER